MYQNRRTAQLTLLLQQMESEYRNAVTVEIDDHDLKDFDEAASSVTISSDLNSEVKNNTDALFLTAVILQTMILQNLK